MKHIILALVLLVYLNKGFSQQEPWQPIWSSVVGSWSYAGIFVDNDRGCILNYNQPILATTNGGETWQSSNVSNGRYIEKVAFSPRGDTGYALLTYMQLNLYRTTNSGVTWGIYSHDPGLWQTKCFHFVNGSVGFSGTNNGLYKTVNAGVNWSRISYLPIWEPSPVESISFINENKGFMIAHTASNDTIILHNTTDGGNSWNALYSTGSTVIRKIYFTDESIGYMLDGNKILRTSDSGVHWNVQHESSALLQSISINAQGIGYAVGKAGGNLYLVKTINNGLSWNEYIPANISDGNLISDVQVHSSYAFITTFNHIYKLQLDWVLPVELSAFTSLVTNNNVILNWTTISEINNSEFQVERKNESNWETVGYVEGNGTASMPHSYQYIDRDIQSGSYLYRLKQIDYNGNFEYLNLSNEVIIAVPKKFNLKQNHPNPFNPLTRIEYTVPYDGIVTLAIYDINGREISSLVKEIKSSGYYSVDFDGSNLSSGIYFYRLIAGNYKVTKRMMLIK
ncbi:T9SS type A sorting domain-containing protein [Candidatus Falkowbacteria bacterium]|nr:MAG: T9SS type A sorting domain-containing protein [Candidatus Falkowbacteria bacterium]